MIVVDTNVLAYLLLPGPHSEAVASVLETDADWRAPVLWRSEFRNALAGYMRANRIDLEQAMQIASEAETVMRGTEELVPTEDVLGCVAASSCTAYDCEFVALAGALEVPLVTCDRKVLAEFPDVAISPADYLGREAR